MEAHPSGHGLVMLSILLLAVLLAWPSAASAYDYRPARNGFLTDFLVLGPIDAADARRGGPEGALARPHLDPTAISPTLGAVEPVPRAEINPRRPGRDGETRDFTWALLSSTAPKVRLDLSDERYQLAYLYVELVVEAPFSGWLSLGADDRIVAWLDGVSLEIPPYGGALYADQHWVHLDLAPGRHALLLKTYNERRTWSAMVRLTDDNHEVPAGLLVSVPGAEREAAGAVDALTLSLEQHANSRGGLDLNFGVDLLGARPIEPVMVCLETSVVTGRSCFALLTASAATQWWVLSDQDLLAELPEGRSQVDLIVSVYLPGGVVTSRTIPFDVVNALGVTEALADARVVAESLADETLLTTMGQGSLPSYEYEIERVAGMLEDGFRDVDYLEACGQSLADLTQALRSGIDPYAGRHGHYLRAYRSPVDGQLQPYAVYVPERYDGEPIPLVVSMHGLGSPIMLNLRQVLGYDRGEDEDPNRAARDFPAEVGNPRAIYVSPYAYGDVVFRFMGEADVLAVMDEMRQAFAIDERRVYLTGLSMGGIGSFELGLHYADHFAALLSLAGMADMRRYNEIRHFPLFPWEGALVDQYSALPFAINALHLPVYAVHGTEDSTSSLHSEVLIDALRALGSRARLTTPELGHNVWRTTYFNDGLMRILGEHRRPSFPDEVALRTLSLRYGTSFWVQIIGMNESYEFAQVQAEFHGGRTRLEVDTENVELLTLSLTEAPESWRAEPLSVVIDGVTICEGACWVTLNAAREGDLEPTWHQVEAPFELAGRKRAGLEGPVQDALHGPLLIVYGTQEPSQTTLLRRLATDLSGMRRRIDIEIPVIADVDLTETMSRDHNLVLLGDAGSNAVLGTLRDRLPIQVMDEGVVVGETLIAGEDLTAIFVYPNPDSEDRYVVVYTGTSPVALDAIRFAARYLPDFVVYDGQVRTARYQRTFRHRPLLAGGYFTSDWSLPPTETWLAPESAEQ